MAKQVMLIDIHDKVHTFDCPPWRLVAVEAGTDSTAVRLTNGETSPQIMVKDSATAIRKRFSPA